MSLTDPLIVVTGLPRSGTSLVMSLLAAGGQPVWIDEIRASDIDNPRGYFEYEPVKSLLRDNAWLRHHGGRAIKIITPLLPAVPVEIPMKVIYVQRDLTEILASQAAMLRHAGKPPVANPSLLETAYQKQLSATQSFLTARPNTEVLHLEHRNIIQHTTAAVAELREFLPRLTNQNAMLAAVEPTLYRQRS